MDAIFPVVMLSPCLRDGGFGGVQRSAALAWERIRENGALICYGISCASTASEQPEVRYCTHSRFAAAMAGLRSAAGVKTLLVWHIGLLKLIPLFWGRNVRVCLYLHGVECWKPLDSATQLCLRRVDMFLTNSDFTWERFVEYNPRWRWSPHRSVALGIDPVGTDASVPSDPPAALITGRMNSAEDYKGHRELIAAWPRVLERVPGAQLWIVGEGDLRPVLEASARQMLPNGEVRFFGLVPEEEKLRLLTRCTCLAMPSRGEGFGIVYVEAMRAARPCLVSSCDAGREIVRPPEAGLEVDPADTSALADAVAALLRRDQQWQAWSSAARSRFNRHFTKQMFHERLLDALAG